MRRQIFILLFLIVGLTGCGNLEKYAEKADRLKEIISNSDEIWERKKELSEELLTGITYDNYELVLQALANGADVNEFNVSDNLLTYNPLMLAYYNACSDDIKTLLRSYGADTSNVSENVWWDRVSNASAVMVEPMIEDGFDLSKKSFTGMTAFTAVIVGNNSDNETVAVLELLRESGYKPTKGDIDTLLSTEDDFTDFTSLKTMKYIIDILVEDKHESWFPSQKVDEVVNGKIKKYKNFDDTDLDLLAAYGSSKSLDYAVSTRKLSKQSGDYLITVAAGFNNEDTFNLLHSLGYSVMTDSIASLDSNSVYTECINNHYDSMLKKIYPYLRKNCSVLAYQIAKYFDDASYLTNYLDRYGISELDLRKGNTFKILNDSKDCKYLPILLKHGLKINEFESVECIDCIETYLQLGGSENVAAECIFYNDYYADANLLEDFYTKYNLTFSDNQLSRLLSLTVSRGFTESTEWLLNHGASLDYSTLYRRSDIEKLEWLIYCTDDMKKLLDKYDVVICKTRGEYEMNNFSS